ncbi:hypothetical protein EOD42_22170 [Rhodovarius crocodyli]|uniref:Uncharacterized protein n=1 Tax=Rhodovarius crocodyli TaxID=1979269 RepID=A0A437M1E5_9PROT|nr:hypothetical protein [Rhodovarius crocodyli]RVT91363.1 hypothetical protein EOD42_22170 [Rhodovarius crocodyli]
MTPLPYSTMTLDQAKEINSRLVQAWMIREGVQEGEVPSFSGIALADAIDASRIMEMHPGERLANGHTRHTCHVDLSRIPQLFAWAVAHG